MGTKYHYDRNGRYKGMTTDTPPSNDNGCLVALVVIVIFCIMCGGC